MSDPTLHHLQRHHGNFDDFRDRMVESHAKRFDSVFWGVWDRHVQPALPEAPALLDMGTGPGFLLRDLAQRYDGARVVGVDIQPAMLETAHEVAREIGPRASVVTADVSRPPLHGLPEGGFDGIVLSRVLHEMHLPQAALSEAARLLAPSGRILLYDWARIPLRRYTEGTLDGGAEQILHFAEHCRYTPEDYVFLGETAGLAPDEVLTRKGGVNTLIVFRKI